MSNALLVALAEQFQDHPHRPACDAETTLEDWLVTGIVTKLTRDNAETAQEFFSLQGHRWRRNGKTQTWKTRPDEFRIPVKHGLRAYDQLTQHNADEVVVVR